MGNSWHKNRLNSMLKLSTYNGVNSHLSSHPATMSPSCDNPGSAGFKEVGCGGLMPGHREEHSLGLVIHLSMNLLGRKP